MKKQILLCLLLCGLSFTASYAQRAFPIGLPTCLEDDFRELEKLYDATGGNSWTNRTNWLTSPNMGTWQGITLTSSGCDIQAINLNFNNLTGTLPMLRLPELLRFQAWSNQLSGALPNFNMPKLVMLTLQDQNARGGGLTGSLPNFNMPNLEALQLWGNKLTGSIPNFNLPNLVTLWLDNNQLSGSIPNFNMPKLTGLALNNNQLTGGAPDFNLPSLKILNISDNPNLGGNLPSLSNSTNIEGYYAFRSGLTGSILNFSQANLKILYINGNKLTGGAPNFNLPSLTQIDISDNPNLGGNLPSLSNSTNLEGYYAVRSSITGSIPNFNQANLKQLWLFSNKLTGSIPNFNLPKLEKLYLHDNKLTGSIPNFNLPLVDTLFIRNNELTGTIPNLNLPNLVSLSIRNNKLSGSVPDFNLPKLKQLRLDTNQLSGKLPNFSNTAFLSNGSNILLRVDANKFVFGDLEGKPWLNVTDIKYAPQAKIPLSFANGQLSVNTGVADNVQQFEWYKNGALVTTTQSSQYRPTSIGTYYCKIKHNTLTVAAVGAKNLVLQSDDYIVSSLPTPLSCLLTITQQMTGMNTNDAKAKLEGFGGQAPYTYKWSTGATTQTVSNLSAGTITGTVTDAAGRQSMCSATISSGGTPSDLFCLLRITQQMTGVNTNDAKAQLEAYAGQGPYTYKWSTGATTQTVSNLSTGTITGTVTDATGATSTCNATIVNNFCNNVTNAGSICCSQTYCQTFEVQPIKETSPVSGGNEADAIEYVWMYSATDIVFNRSRWATISGATDKDLPVSLIPFSTTYGPINIVRCVRRANCADFLESNMIQLMPKAIAVIQGPKNVCLNQNVSFTAIENPTETEYFWTSAAGGYSGVSATFQFSQLGAQELMLSVTTENCTIHQKATVNVMGCEVLFQNTTGSKTEVKKGVKGLNQNILVYPNPAQNLVNIEIADSDNSDMTVEVYNTIGSLVQRQKFDKMQTPYQINTENLPSGSYIIKISRANGFIQSAKINKM